MRKQIKVSPFSIGQVQRTLFPKTSNIASMMEVPPWSHFGTTASNRSKERFVDVALMLLSRFSTILTESGLPDIVITKLFTSSVLQIHDLSIGQNALPNSRCRSSQR